MSSLICLTALTASILIGPPIMAQSPAIDAKHFDKLSKNAPEHVEVNLSGTALRLDFWATRGGVSLSGYLVYRHQSKKAGERLLLALQVTFEKLNRTFELAL